MKDGQIIVLANKERAVRRVSPAGFRRTTTAAGWQRKTIDLFLSEDRIGDRPVRVTEPVPCGREALIVIGN